MKYLQRLGRSLMLPVAMLPAAAILMGIGYWIDPVGWGANNVAAAFLIKAGGAFIDNMAILFAIGVAIGMSDDGEGTAALSGLVSWLLIQTMLSSGVVAMLTKVDVADVNPAFGKINNQFIGILSGLIGAACYNRFKNTRLPDALGFFSGRRSVGIVTAGATLVVIVVLFFVWPFIYNGLVALGTGVIATGALGAGIYAFLNRLLIPFGLHHALNSVFWFDIAGIDDIGKFWGSIDGGVLGQTGMYMSGFFPVMMFGLPAAALAMYHTAKPERKNVAGGLLLSAALASFFTGVTEPLEFSFMFLAPVAYVVHALLTGVSAFVCALLPFRSGFNFSAGFVDWVLSFRAPFAQNPWLLIPIGLVCGVIYYVVFRFMIVKLDMKTPGREDDIDEEERTVTLGDRDFADVAAIIISGLGGVDNITSLDYCITRLRMEVKDYTQVNEKLIRSSGAAGIMRPSKNAVQIVIGTQVQFVADEMKNQMEDPNLVKG